MYKIQKFKWDDRKRHFWSSDLHVFHNPKWNVPIWQMRGYESHLDSAEKILNKINERVGENDVLWYLGDAFLNTNDNSVKEWLSKVKCKNIKYLFGNHESSMYRIYSDTIKKQYNLDNVEIYPVKYKNVEFLGNHQEIKIGKQLIIMNHFSLRTWHSDSKGSWMLSGHSHLTDVVRTPQFPQQKGFDVGWDYKNDVWSFDEIEDVMSTKSIMCLDHNI